MAAALAGAGYLADERISQVVFLAARLDKPILAEGPAGVGKTELAKAVATALRRPLVRLQCYEGLDESKALYEWNYRKQLLRLQADQGREWAEVEADIFTEDFLLTRPLLEAIRSPEPVVLLIDEVDRLEVETEALLLEVLSDFQVSIPELGTIQASSTPFVVLTSNNTRELSEALKRRCVYLFIDYPTAEAELRVVRLKVPDLAPALAKQAVDLVQRLRRLDLKKSPSVSETIDWAKALVMLNAQHLDKETLNSTLTLLLKHEADVQRARAALDDSRPAPRRRPPPSPDSGDIFDGNIRPLKRI